MSYPRNISLDTNVVFSGLYYRGKPNELIRSAQAGARTIFISEYIKEELIRVVARTGVPPAVTLAFFGLPEVRIISDDNYAEDRYFKEAQDRVRHKNDWPVYAFFKFMLEKNAIDRAISGDSDLLTSVAREGLGGRIQSVAEFLADENNIKRF